MPVVMYADYRRLESQRRDANNSIMALLAGSKLAVNTLGLTAGSTLPLSEIFPRVPHIARFNLRTDIARSLLDDAERHLATMAVPYVLALHEDFMLHCASLLRKHGRMSASAYGALNAKTMHARFSQNAGGTFSIASLELFQLVRTLRNSQIHEGGRVNEECHAARIGLSAKAESLWEYLTKEQLSSCTVGDDVALGHPQLVGTLAITHRLMEEANEMLQQVIPSWVWANMAVADAKAEKLHLAGNPAQRLRKLRGFVRMHYGALALPDDEVRDAAVALGVL
ncbi:MAG: hypothetical protein AB7Q42_04455 [Acidimicrobiia bacterium]